MPGARAHPFPGVLGCGPHGPQLRTKGSSPLVLPPPPKQNPLHVLELTCFEIGQGAGRHSGIVERVHLEYEELEKLICLQDEFVHRHIAALTTE